MYPNPQDALPLPPRPDLDHYRKRARDLVRACHSADAAAIDAWAARWVADLAALRPDLDRARHAREADRHARQVAAFARERMGSADCALTRAQYVIARAHGFASWPRLAHHLLALAGASSISTFEAAADAVVAGDLDALGWLLGEEPRLVAARSGREHGATLLHYVSANGVENFRQRTPPSVVEVARLLLDAGAEVDAAAEVYGGGATTLGLVVTSAHPRAAGVQLSLADLLIARGAQVEVGMVRSCLANGCPEAAAHLARRGLPLGLDEAAGIGRVDVVARSFEEGPGLDDPAWRREVAEALSMAAWYGHPAVVDLLVGRGFDPSWWIGLDDGEGRTALHVAAFAGKADIVAVLLRRGAPVDAADAVYGTSPLVWALHAWLVEGRAEAAAFRAVVRLLVGAGAAVPAEWLDDDRVRADAELAAMLARGVPSVYRDRDRRTDVPPFPVEP